jgi:hypothetical protein
VRTGACGSRAVRGSRGSGGRALAIVALALAASLVPDVTQAQCAMCRTALASPEGQRLAAALRSGILLLFAAPFTIFATVAVLAVRAQRRRRDCR